MRWRDMGSAHTDRLDELRQQSPEELLGVRPGASPRQIRSAYLERVKAYHPDRLDEFLRRHGSEVMKILNAAYQRALERRAR